MTKAELIQDLRKGKTFGDLFRFRPGQECSIFKSDSFRAGKEIIYIPDIDLNRIPVDSVLGTAEEVAEAVSNCYTGNDFLEQCDGDFEMAKDLFEYCDWQHPCSAYDDGCFGDVEE